MKKSFFAVVSIFASAAFALDVEPEITNLQFEQNANRMVTISYTLTKDAILSLDLIGTE